MDDQPRPAYVAALVESIDTRGRQQTDWMLRALLRDAWPGGHTDRHDPMASDWVRRWGPSRIQAPYLGDCACAAGRCTVCN
jgi:hypothetical protein